MNIQWNAGEYQKNFAFVYQYGSSVLELLDAPAGSLVVDLGCGNGALTQALAERGYAVLGIDGSAEMLRLAREKHPALAFRQADARDFHLDTPADAIFSNAVFHWIDDADQDTLIANLYGNLRPGGQLVCEFGGHGCAETVHAVLERAFASRGLPYPRVFYFPTIGEYAPRLERAGFRVEEAFLFDRPTPQNGPDGLESWIRMFCKKSFEGLDTETTDALIAEAVNDARGTLLKDGVWTVDYVRIRIKARRI